MARSNAPTRKMGSELAAYILQLLETISQMQAELEAMGLFPHDRELLECTGCDLVEDVTIEGRLITIHQGNDEFIDTGLKFERLNEDIFACPTCKTRIKATML